MSVTIKAFLHRQWGEEPVEIRRFTIDQDVTTSYAYLLEKISQVFPSLRPDNVIVTWIDSDGDRIVISSDEELIESLDQFDGSVFRLFLKKREPPCSFSGPPREQPTVGSDEEEGEEPGDEGGDRPSAAKGEGEPSQGVFHPNVICDGCHGSVYGNRYKCLVCDDYDLCSACEAKGLHSEHNMVTIANPWGYSPWGIHHPWAGHHPRGHHHGRRCHQRPRNQGCPYRRGCCGGPPPQVWGQAWMAPPFAHCWGGAGQCGRPGGRWWAQQSEAAGKEKTDKQEPMETEKPEGKGREGEVSGEERAQLEQEQRRSIIHDIGEAVSSFLEPFGVKVDLDVLGDSQEPKKKEGDPTAPPPVPSGANVNTARPPHEYTLDPASGSAGVPYTPPSPWVPPTSDQGVPSATPGETLPGATPQLTPIEQTVAQLQGMGFDDEGGWLTELVKAKGGDIERVLDALHPSQSS